MSKIKVFDGVFEIKGGKAEQISGTDNPPLVKVMNMMIETHNPLKYVPVWDNEYAEMICSTITDAEILELVEVPSVAGRIY